MTALAVSTVYEAAGRLGLIGHPLVRVVPGSRISGPVRTVRCGQDDNLGVHRALDHLERGEILVAVMPEPAPVALVGELLALRAKARGAAGLLIDAAVRDVDELAALGLPIWARWVGARGAAKDLPGELDVAVTVGGVPIARGDTVVLDGDGAVVVPAARVGQVVAASRERAAVEAGWMPRLRAGESTLDLLGLRRTV